jgi:hypothetical protein
MVEFFIGDDDHFDACRVDEQVCKAGRENCRRSTEAAGVACEMVHVEHEHPYQAIIDTAGSKGCDLIVMASHGRHGISAIVLGSETVARDRRRQTNSPAAAERRNGRHRHTSLRCR